MEKENIRNQFILYFLFAILMILLNYLIQKSNQLFLYPFACQNRDTFPFLTSIYCRMNPYNYPELFGSILAVGITYIVKFMLDKFVVFKRIEINLRQISREFMKYFFFALITTAENIGIQFLMTNFLHTPLELSMGVALAIGYTTKFFFDRTYVFIEKNKN
ncbi:MAG: GtrA family protein [Promethearchaeota archaeon]